MTEKIDGILIDFDGVVCQNSVDLTIDFIHSYTIQFAQIPRFFIENYVKIISCFPVEMSIRLFFTAIGLENKIEEFIREYHKFDQKNKNLEIDPYFTEFIDFCKNNKINYRIFSLANRERIEQVAKIDRDFIYSINSSSKADIQTYLDMEKNMGINLKHWVYLDDNPLALFIGKQANLKTFMMLNEIYKKDDFEKYKENIDFTVNNFKEFHKIIKLHA